MNIDKEYKQIYNVINEGSWLHEYHRTNQKQAIPVSLKLGATSNDYKKKLVQVMNNNYYDESPVLSILVSL